MDFILFSIFDWSYHSHGHSDFQIAKALATRGHKVLFVNTVGMRLPPLKRRSAPVAKAIRKIKSILSGYRVPAPDVPNLVVFTPLQIPIFSGWVGGIVRAATGASIGGAISRFGLRDFTAIVTLPTFAEAALSLQPRTLIYNRSDLHSALEGVDLAGLHRMEEQLFERANAVLYASRELFEAERTRVDRAVWVGHGVDVASFSPEGPRSAEFDGLPRPRVAFFGDLRRRLVDFNLIEQVARRLPDVSFVLGGAQLDELGGLAHCANVHLFPPCLHRDMPTRWRSVDAAILPYVVNEWTLASAPIKQNEILAMGLPAVGTPLPAFSPYPDQIAIASDPETFARQLSRILAEPSPAETRRRAGLEAAAGFTSWLDLADRIVAIAIGEPMQALEPVSSRDHAI